jgi:hypothetical protein
MSSSEEGVNITFAVGGEKYLCEKKRNEDGLYIIEIIRKVPPKPFMYASYHTIEVLGNSNGPLHIGRYIIGLYNESEKSEVIKDLESIHKEDIIHNPHTTYYLSLRSITSNYYTSPTDNSNGMKPAK